MNELFKKELVSAEEIADLKIGLLSIWDLMAYYKNLEKALNTIDLIYKEIEEFIYEDKELLIFYKNVKAKLKANLNKIKYIFKITKIHI